MNLTAQIEQKEKYEKFAEICPPLTKIPKTFTNYIEGKIAEEQQSKEIVLGILVCSGVGARNRTKPKISYQFIKWQNVNTLAPPHTSGQHT